jgi:Ca2+-binding EF-hand superfamily protein
MMRALSITGFLGVLIGLATAEDGAAVRLDNDALRAGIEEQFTHLDANRDGKLDSRELSKLPADDLTKLRSHGLNVTTGASREEFTKALFAVAAAEDEGAVAAKAAETDETEDSPTKPDEDGTKPTAAKSDSTLGNTSSKTKTGDQTAAEAPRGSRGSFKKTHFVPELPAEYVARDKNGDGQIGLYEWDRRKFAEFAKLDKNGDGFLTPAELLPKETLKNLYAGASKPAAAAGGKGTTESKSGDDGAEKAARDAFGGLDRNKDGMIDETEWSRSQTTRQMFESASVQVSLPVNVETFVPLYRRAKETSGRDEPR